MMKYYKIGETDIEIGSKYLNLYLDENNYEEDQKKLINKLKENGYLLIKGLHDKQEISSIRKKIISILTKDDIFDSGKNEITGNLKEGIIKTSTVRGNEKIKIPELDILYSRNKFTSFFEKILGGEIISPEFKWLRTVGKGSSSKTHCDSVYMGRGTKKMLTCWTPIGDVSPQMGGLAICLNSHKKNEILKTYAKSDVDIDLIEGHFTDNPLEMVDKFGCKWATTHFEAGDVLIFSIFLMHASLTNTTNSLRISCDTRYQRKDDKRDNRWFGECPLMHYRFHDDNNIKEKLVDSRLRWGI